MFNRTLTDRNTGQVRKVDQTTAVTTLAAELIEKFPHASAEASLLAIMVTTEGELHHQAEDFAASLGLEIR